MLSVAFIAGVFGFILALPLLPLDHNGPCYGFQDNSHNAQGNDHPSVRLLPMILPPQCIKSLVHVRDAQRNRRVPDYGVEPLPMRPIFVILIRPHEQRGYLKSGKAEERDADASVGLVADSLGF
ncbi:unnamed protein product [Cuscuta epithymum]|uniref:Secreted protein n=1 Tax=Cuscuta epithymum TaxID=186058 RepID=A0AAV0D336_9ASTE|nr:unnamed protein product [Cuscuta epithymum]